MLKRITSLVRNLAIYGFGDVATSIAGFLLLPVYVRYLSPEDYGVIGLLLSVEVVVKILFRWGVDGAFMRLYFDCEDQKARQTLASTIFVFLLAANGLLLAGALTAAPALAAHLFGGQTYTTALGLVLVNTFVVGFYFIPFHVLRIQERSPEFIALSMTRSVSTLVLRLVLVVGFGLGVLGIVLADVLVTAVFTVVLARWFAPLLRPTFSRRLLVESLRFGLPRLPHGLAHQTMAVADRYLLGAFVSLREVGIYSIGATFGLALKLFLSAFEYAWAPFYFGIMREPDAKATYRLVTTYGVAALVVLAAGLAAIADDLVRLMTTPDFSDAARVIPWVGLGVVFQGVYLLTSIGFNLTKRTEYYPVSTGIAAAVSLVANLILIPRWGAVGAAWSNALGYGVLAATAFVLSQRVYPMTYEYGRLARIALAGGAAYAASRLLPVDDVPPLVALLAHGTAVVAVYPALLAVSGFLAPQELAVLRRLAAAARAGRTTRHHEPPAELAGEILDTPLDDEVLPDPAPPGSPDAQQESKPSRRTSGSETS